MQRSPWIDLNGIPRAAEGRRDSSTYASVITLHDSAAALLGMIIAYDLTGVAGKALSIVIGTQVRIRDGRDRHRDAVTVGV